MDFSKEDKTCIIFLCGALTAKKAAKFFNNNNSPKEPITKAQVKEIREHFKKTGSVMNVYQRSSSNNGPVMDHFLSGLDAQNGGWPTQRLYPPEFVPQHPSSISGSSKTDTSSSNSLIVPSSSRPTYVKHETDASEYEELETFGLQVKNLLTTTKGAKAGKKCPICDKMLSRGDKLRNHMKIHTNNYPYNCPTCGVGFLRSEGLRVHTRVHTGERPFVCQICGKSYTRKDKLTRHAINHTGLRPFPCEQCSKTFTRKDKLQRHTLIHKLEKPFNCMMCVRDFKTQREFSSHNAKKHPERSPFTPPQLHFAPHPPHQNLPSAISLTPIVGRPESSGVDP